MIKTNKRILVFALSFLFIPSLTFAVNQSFKITHIGTPSNGYVTIWIDSTFDCDGTNTSTLRLNLNSTNQNDDFQMLTLLIDAAKNRYNVIAVTDYTTGQFSYHSGDEGRCRIDVDDGSNPSIFMVEYPQS
jgi:hypothetical protein